MALMIEIILSALIDDSMVCLSSTPCRQLNALRDDLFASSVMNERMHVIGSSHAIQDDHPIPLLGLKEPVDPGLATLGKLQQESLLAATMGDVLRMTGYGMPVHPWACSVALLP
jgi:hypothetical protein